MLSRCECQKPAARWGQDSRHWLAGPTRDVTVAGHTTPPVAEAVAGGSIGAERGAGGEAGGRPPVRGHEVGEAVGGAGPPVALLRLCSMACRAHNMT